MSIFRLNGLIMHAGESISQPFGQSSARWQVLGRAVEPQTVAQMARDAGYARQGVQRVADTLAEEGLVVYKDHPSDRRTKIVEITPKGLEILAAMYERQTAWAQQIVAQLGADQLASLADALEIAGNAIAAADVDSDDLTSNQGSAT
ncbi:MAG: MarR family transcriptional regulator [Anaerolineae bacterium]